MDLSLPQLLGGLLTASLLYLLVRTVYNVFFHPLRAYPGPWYRAVSRLPYTISIFRGDVTHKAYALHQKYGQIVRITPDTLSYTCSQAWLDIYGLKQTKNGGGNLPKDPKWYIAPPGNVDTISTANNVDHRRLRRLQAHAFSDKALSMQESFLQKHTDQYIACLRREAQQCHGVVDIVKWVNFLTTDLIGDLSFSESFGGLTTGSLHPWLESTFTTLKAFTFMREILLLPSWMVGAAMACIPKHMLEHQKESLTFGAKAAQRRIERGSDQPDFLSYILKHDGTERGMSDEEVGMAAITFIVAGSETTATMVSGTTYLLLRHPDVLRKLTEFIRRDFPKNTDLSNGKLQHHEYLNAVVKEGLRLYPPATDFLFRVTGNESAMIAGRVVPPHTSLTMNLWAAHRDPANFYRPLEFIPERWLKDAPAEFNDDDRVVFKPFSYGPRDCIGKNLAWAEMRLIISKMIWSLDLLSLEPDSDHWIERQKTFSLWEKPPLNVKIAPRAQ